MKEFKYSWCWSCNASKIDLGEENTCCARWYDAPELQQKAWEWSKENSAPVSPASEEIDEQLNCDNYTNEEKLICAIFDRFSYGKYYWLPKLWADKIGHTIPTYEELCEKYSIEPVYDCKTGKQWSIDEKKEVYEKKGWYSEESFETEEIPYNEFIRRARISSIGEDGKLRRLR